MQKRRIPVHYLHRNAARFAFAISNLKYQISRVAPKNTNARHKLLGEPKPHSLIQEFLGYFL
jgi:hypothetical protein